MTDESTIEQPTDKPIKRPRGLPRKGKPVEPVVKRPKVRPQVENNNKNKQKRKRKWGDQCNNNI